MGRFRAIHPSGVPSVILLEPEDQIQAFRILVDRDRQFPELLENTIEKS